MEDIFYLTREHVSLADIEREAGRLGYLCDYAEKLSGIHLYVKIDSVSVSQIRDPATSEVIQKEFQDYWIFWFWPIGYTGISLDALQQKRVDEYAPQSQFVISYRTSSLPKLRRFLLHIMQSYGGWVARDDDWETVYDVSNLENLGC